MNSARCVRAIVTVAHAVRVLRRARLDFERGAHRRGTAERVQDLDGIAVRVEAHAVGDTVPLTAPIEHRVSD